MNFQAVAQLIKDFEKGSESKPETKEFNLNKLFIIYKLSKGDPNIWAKEYGEQYAEEVKAASEWILEENGMIKPETVEE